MQNWMNFRNGDMQVKLLALYNEYALFVNEKNGSHIVAWLPEFKGINVSWGQGHYLGQDFNKASDFWKEKVGFLPPPEEADKVTEELLGEPLKNPLEVTLKISISQQDLEGFIEDALIGGNYWCGIDNRTDMYQFTKAKLIKQGNANPCLGEICAQVLIDGGTLKIYEIEDAGIFHVDLASFMKSLGEIAQENLDLTDLDLNMDVVLQKALFGEVMYG